MLPPRTWLILDAFEDHRVEGDVVEQLTTKANRRRAVLNMVESCMVTVKFRISDVG